MPKICEIIGVREHVERSPVELWRNDKTGRLVVVALNEGGCSGTEVDLLDLIDWLQAGPGRGMVLADDTSSNRDNLHPARDRESA
jgi:hypothetical protein